MENIEAYHNKYTILLIDDEVNNLKITGDYLNNKYNLFVATNAYEGLKIINKTPPDLILLDIYARYRRFFVCR